MGLLRRVARLTFNELSPASLDGLARGIADRPEPERTRALCAAPPEHLVWLSCGLDSFLAQAAWLLERTRLRLRSLEAYALFPFTEHVATLAHFTNS